MSESRNDDPRHGADHPHQQPFRHPADAGDLAIQQQHREHYHANCDKRRPGNNPSPLQRPQQRDVQGPVVDGILMFQRREKIRRISRQANRTRCNRERRTEGKLPDKKKRHQPAEFAGTVNFAQETIRAPRPRHRRTQFGGDQAVTGGEQRSGNPSEHGLRTAHGAHDQRNGDERPHADHVDHVQRSSAAQPDAAN